MANSLKKIIPFFMGICLSVCAYAQSTVNLYFVVDGVEVASQSGVPKDAAYDLTTITNTLRSEGKLDGCRGYSFIGWSIGAPVMPGESATAHMEVTPAANTILYAVFENSSISTNDYVRVTSTADLEIGAEYIIVCYHTFGSGPQYYALSNSDNETYEVKTGETYTVGSGWGATTYDVYARRYMAVTVRQYPDAGVISSPANEVIWTLGGTPDAWTWTNKGNSKQLYIRDNTKETGYYTNNGKKWNQRTNPQNKIIVNPGNTCSITASAGSFHFQSGSYYLTYIPDAISSADRFITGTEESAGYVYYLYKKASACTSYPGCTPWTVHLDAVDGTVGTTGEHTIDMEESNGGSGVTLPSAVKPDDGCADWSFAGWHKDSPVETTNTAPSLQAAGHYDLTYNGETLYAVYRKSRAGGYTYSSYPHCTPYTVLLHGCGGTIGDTDETNAESTESAAGEGIVLPMVTPLCADQGWTFVGWFVGEELEPYKDVEFTDYLSAGSTFHPSRNGMKLYAIYSRPTERFRIVAYGTAAGLELPQVGENYLITYYSKPTDYQISSVAKDANHLSAVAGESPMDGGGYYLIAEDEALWWTVGGSNNAWTFYNVKAKKYLTIGNNTSGLSDSPETFTINRTSTSTTQERNLSIKSNNSTKYIRYSAADGFYGGSSEANCYLYRQVKEYTSWPHCTPFTVIFDGCGGSAGATSMTESAAYAGIKLPGASPDDCAREGWTFAGWSKTPVADETDEMTFNLYPANMKFNPTRNNMTLYAVYFKKKNTYTKVSTMDDLYLGANYIITSGTNAIKNVASGTKVTAQSISSYLSGTTITMDDAAAIEWQMNGSKGEYEFYNRANTCYWDFITPGEGRLRQTNEDNFYIQNPSSGQFTVSSNVNPDPFGSDRRKVAYSSGFYTAKDPSNLYFYRQQATYHSYPLCADAIDALRWTKEGDYYYVYVESYTHGEEPRMNNSTGSPTLITSGDMMGTWKINYDPSILLPCSETSFQWGTENAKLKIPHLILGSTNSSTLPSDCSECDVVVADGGTLTVNSDRTIHALTLYDGGSVVVNNGNTLTVNSLILSSDIVADNSLQKAPSIVMNGTGAISLPFEDIYRDMRIDEDRYYWFSLPYDVDNASISYANVAANGKAPVYRTDYYVKYYDGWQRADDANSGIQKTSYWTHMADRGKPFTLKAGLGYQIGIADQKATNQADGNKHAKRVIRFTMKPNGTTWNAEEKNYQKAVVVAPSECYHPLNQVHAGWNLIGNPYLRAYTVGGSLNGESGMQNGAWTKEIVDGTPTGYYILDEEATSTTVPYFTVYNQLTKKYSQELASSYRALRPFEALFVQIQTGDHIYFKSSGASRNNMPAYMRAAQYDAPVRTGITLEGNGQKQRTGVVLSEEYTPAYEIGADLVKYANAGQLNLYTLNADNQQLAFNGLSEEDAVDPIPVGVTFPVGGEYMFSFDAEQYSTNDIESLVLIDKQEGVRINLKYGYYTFVTDAGTVDNRFEILIRRAKGTTTDIDAVGFEDGEARKIIQDNHLYIIRDNEMYNAMGGRVR